MKIFVRLFLLFYVFELAAHRSPAEDADFFKSHANRYFYKQWLLSDQLGLDTPDDEYKNLLIEHRKLLEVLRDNVHYKESFRDRTYLLLTIEDPILNTKKTRHVDPAAIAQWRERLLRTFNELKFDDSRSEFSMSEIIDLSPLKFQQKKKGKANIPKSQRLISALLKLLNNQNLYALDVENQFEYLKLNLTDEIASKLKNPGTFGLTSANKSELLKNIEGFLLQKQQVEVALNLLLDKIELLVVIKKINATLNRQDYVDKLESISEELLNHLCDVADVLKPRIKKLAAQFAWENPENVAKLISERLLKIKNTFIEEEVKVDSTIYLEEVSPHAAIYRGIVGGDCATSHSFPYPLDPYEKVFFIFRNNNQKREVIGYVAATIKNINDLSQPGLYVHTIAGLNLVDSEVRAILRGLYEMREKLLVKEIILPVEKHIKDLNNYKPVRAVFNQLIQGKNEIKISHPDMAIRSIIEKEIKDFNTAKYDWEINNSVGHIISFENHDEEGFLTHAQEIEPRLGVTDFDSTIIPVIAFRKYKEYLKRNANYSNTTSKIFVSMNLEWPTYRSLFQFLAPTKVMEITDNEREIKLSQLLDKYGFDPSLKNDFELTLFSALLTKDAYSPGMIDTTIWRLTKAVEKGIELSDVVVDHAWFNRHLLRQRDIRELRHALFEDFFNHKNRSGLSKTLLLYLGFGEELNNNELKAAFLRGTSKDWCWLAEMMSSAEDAVPLFQRLLMIFPAGERQNAEFAKVSRGFLVGQQRPNSFGPDQLPIYLIAFREFILHAKRFHLQDLAEMASEIANYVEEQQLILPPELKIKLREYRKNIERSPRKFETADQLVRSLTQMMRENIAVDDPE
jgi:hypothetical protein